MRFIYRVRLAPFEQHVYESEPIGNFDNISLAMEVAHMFAPGEIGEWTNTETDIGFLTAKYKGESGNEEGRVVITTLAVCEDPMDVAHYVNSFTYHEKCEHEG